MPPVVPPIAGWGKLGGGAPVGGGAASAPAPPAAAAVPILAAGSPTSSVPPIAGWGKLGGGAAASVPAPPPAIAVPVLAAGSPTSSVSSGEDEDRYDPLPSAGGLDRVSLGRARASQGGLADKTLSLRASQGGDKVMPLPVKSKMPNAFEVESAQYSSRRSSEKRRLIQMIRAGSVKVKVGVKQWHRSCVVSVRWQLVLILTVSTDLGLLLTRVIRASICAWRQTCPQLLPQEQNHDHCPAIPAWTNTTTAAALLLPGETESERESVQFFREAFRHFNAFWRRHPGWHVFWTLMVATIYAADVVMRMRAVGARKFLRKKRFIFDACVAVFTVLALIVLLETCFQEDCFRCYADDTSSPFLDIMRAARIVRFFQMVRLFPHLKVMRYAVSGSKRRFVDWLEDIDLDLTYVTKRMIAMSVPATGYRRYFRNPMAEVARFFETFHPNRYLIINCCPELPYETTLFHSGKVVCFDIQDHMPPTMPQFVEYIRVVLEWMGRHPDNIVAVHCKGGKGRTGSFVTAWLLYTRDCVTVDDALNTFALARTDISSGLMCAAAEMQGVETPSQVRYLCQFDRLLTGTPADGQLDLPTQRDVMFSFMTFHEIWRKPPPETMLICVQKVLSGAQSFVIFWSDPFPGDTPTVSLNNLRCSGDLRVSVFDASLLEEARAKNENGVAFAGDCVHPLGANGPSHWGSTPRGPSEGNLGSGYTGRRCLAGQEPGCLFYFILHTSFLEIDTAAAPAMSAGPSLGVPSGNSMAEGTLKVQIGSEDNHGGMDKAWKARRKYHLEGHVALDFRK